MKTKRDINPHNISMKDELLTISDVSFFLKVAEKTVLRMIRRGDIPCVRIGGQWRFPRSMIEDWVFSKMKSGKKSGLMNYIEESQNIIPLSRLTGRSLILLDIIPGSKETVLSQLVEPLKNEKIIPGADLLLTKLIKREEMASTAIGPGIAYPHLRSPDENFNKQPVILFGICSEGTDFISLDGDKTYMFCLLCINSIVAHLRVLARLMQLFRKKEIVQQFCTFQSKDDFLNHLIQLEQKCPRHDSNV